MNAILNKTEYYTKTYNNYYQLIYTSVLAKIRNCEESKDICQEIFTRLYECFDGIINPRKWLYGAMKYVMYDYYHKEIKNKSNIDIDEIEYNPCLCCNSLIDDNRILIDRAMKDLEGLIDVQDKNIFDLIAIAGSSYGEVAEQVGMTFHQVRYRYKKTIRLLAGYLNNHGIHTVNDLI